MLLIPIDLISVADEFLGIKAFSRFFERPSRFSDNPEWQAALDIVSFNFCYRRNLRSFQLIDAFRILDKGSLMILRLLYFNC